MFHVKRRCYANLVQENEARRGSRKNGALVILTISREASEIMAMKNPPHVGGLVRREAIEQFGLTATEAAKVLGLGGRRFRAC